MYELIKFISHDWLNILAVLALVGLVVGNVYYIRTKGAYQYAKKHILAGSVLVAIFVVVVAWSKGMQHIVDRDTLWNLFDNVISNYVAVVAVACVYVFERILKNVFEDKEKLSQDYKGIAKMYSTDELITIPKGEEPLIYPVKEIGSGSICICANKLDKSILDEKIVIRDDQEKMFSLPDIVRENFCDILKVHDSSAVYNNLNVRVSDMSFQDNTLTLETERTYYYYSLVTNRASDYDWSSTGMTLRELFEPGPRIRPLKSSQFSNHLGYNGFIISKDGYVVFVKRKNSLSIAKRTYGDSIGASMKSKWALEQGSGAFTAEGLVKSILNEVLDELCIKTENCEKLHIIGAYRDLVECGKPQLLFVVESNLNAKTITDNFRNGLKEENPIVVNLDPDLPEGKEPEIIPPKSLATKKEKTEKRVKTDGNKLVWIHLDDLKKVDYEESGISYADRPIPENETRPHGFFEYHGRNFKVKRLRTQELHMVPSASASVWMMVQWWKKTFIE